MHNASEVSPPDVRVEPFRGAHNMGPAVLVPRWVSSQLRRCPQALVLYVLLAEYEQRADRGEAVDWSVTAIAKALGTNRRGLAVSWLTLRGIGALDDTAAQP